jgi:hypothetical protein
MQSKEEVRRHMFTMIEQWQQSGLSQKAWCRQSGMAYHVFHYWYKRYRNTKSTLQTSSFTELKVQPAAFGFMELLFPDGKRLLFHQPVNSDFIKALIS